MRIADDGISGAPPEDADLEDLCRVFGDPRVGATLGGVRDRANVRATIARWRGNWERFGFGVWLFRGPDAALLGWSGFGPAEAIRPGAVELLYGFAPECWGRGLATRLSRRALEALARVAPDTDLVGYTLTTNLASQRVLTKLGFERRGEFERAGLPHVLFEHP